MTEQRTGLSNALRVTDLNDFLTPSVECVLPLGGGAFPESTSDVAKPLRVEPAGSVLAPIIPVKDLQNDKPLKAKITLSDCLSCSGCVTSAETVLLSTENLDQLKKVLFLENGQDKNRTTVAAISQQVAASIAVHYGIGLQETARKLSTFLRENCGFDRVVDVSLARHLSLIESAAEFLDRYRKGKKLTITSACPGWLTYAEKTQEPKLLDYISVVRSPQAMLHFLAKALMPKEKRNMWICSIMPCHDKKLEANRDEFVSNSADGLREREVACVITAGEIVQLMNERSFNIMDADEGYFDMPFGQPASVKFGVAVGSGSGGYADYILRVAAEELLGVQLPFGHIEMKKESKSGDLQSLRITDESGQKQLHFAKAYGFRSMQSVLRKIRRGECTYNYIELMSCPGGCTNGGGLLEMKNDAESMKMSLKQQSKEHTKKVMEQFLQAPPISRPIHAPGVMDLYTNVIYAKPGSAESLSELGLSIRSRKERSEITPSSLDW